MRGLVPRASRIVVSGVLTTSALLAMATATQTAASAGGFGSDAFMNLDGSARYVANTTPAPTNQFGWANSGPSAGSTCSAGQVDVGGSHGLYNCGAPNPSATDTVPLPPKYVGPAVGTDGVLGQMFATTPDNQPSVCSTQDTSYVFNGGNKWNDGLSALGYHMQKVTPKDGIADAYVISRRSPTGASQVFMGAQRTESLGDSHVDFQFLQDSMSITGSCSGGFSGSREQGDVMVSMDYVNGGGVTSPTIYQWHCNVASAPGTKCDTTGTWVTDTVSLANASQISNSAAIPCGGWVCEGASGPSQIGDHQFVEGALNLSALNPVIEGHVNQTVGCTSSVLVETRTSQSGPGQIKALVKPFALPTCQPTDTETTPSQEDVVFGGTLHDSVEVEQTFGSIVPTGTVTFYVCSNASTGCNPANGTKLGSAVTLNNGTANGPDYTPPAPGNYCFAGVYQPAPGTFFMPSADTSAGECFEVAPAPTATTTTVIDNGTGLAWTGNESGTPSAHDTAVVAADPSFSNAPKPTGTISYLFFPNGSCTKGTGTAAGTNLALGAPSSTEGPLSQGVYSFQATYSGDSNYAGSVGGCETFSFHFPVVTAVKSSTPADGSVVHPGDNVTYTITLSNAGGVDATGVGVTDVVPAGTTYVTGSASDAGTLKGSTVTWSGLTVPATGTKAITFHVTVNANDTDGQVIPNHAVFTNVNTPQASCIQSSDTTSATCDTNTVNLTVAIPIINVVKSEPTPGDGQTVTAGQSAPITYKLAVTNAGSAAATNAVVTDVIPAGATYVAGSATPAVEASYNSSTKTITWTIPSVPGKSGSTPGEVDLTFQVTVNSADANGSTITNQAAFTNLNTPNCTAGSTTAVCLTNTVSNPVVVPPPLQTQPAPQVAPTTTTTTTVAKHALAFTGLNARTLAILAIALVTFGTGFVLIGRRRRPNN